MARDESKSLLFSFNSQKRRNNKLNANKKGTNKLNTEKEDTNGKGKKEMIPVITSRNAIRILTA
ncbi:MAG TPA: hypothetical protein VJ880_03670 [Allomuricauda sp.]|nr:hypothetical protein [Allomuricauda sp.]